MLQPKVKRRQNRFNAIHVTRLVTVVAAGLAITAMIALDLDGTTVQAQATLNGDVERGRTKAALCAACHGVAGVSVNPLWPSLAGQQEQYLVKQIKAFRDGEREEITMQPFVANLSDQDVADLAAFYAALSPCP